jgi:hypothetical protein
MIAPPAIVYHVPSPFGTLDLERLLRCIREVESSRPGRGRHGERGPYQFMRATWERCTRWPFRCATDPRIADMVAHQHALHIAYHLRGTGVPVTPATFAAAWNEGENRAARGARHDYAQHVSNLYYAP